MSEFFNTKPLGITSSTKTSVAVFGPLFVTVKVHLTKSPQLGLVTLAVFTIAKSAAFATLTEASS